MITKLTYDGDCVFVHAGDTTQKTTSAFTRGSIVLDALAHTATFAKLPPVAVPEDIPLEAGKTLNFQLVAPDGELRSQKRSGELVANEKQPGVLHIGGTAQSPRLFPAEEGWGNAVYKYRAYFGHPGLNLDEQIPEWLQNSIKRQKEYWNHLAWLCREARRKCSPTATEEVIKFVQETILPEIDAFNDSLGVSKQKMKHPAKLKIEEPGVDGLWKFAGELRGRIEKGRQVPDGLLDKVVAFAEQFKPDYTPLNEFIKNFQEIAEKEAAALNLRRFEIRPLMAAFKAALNRRKTTKMAWSEGWPMIKYHDSPRSGDWGLHYYFNKAGVSSSLLETEEGVPGLTFGPPLNPADTNHKNLAFEHGGKTLREAEISILGDNKERWVFRFGVLQSRSLPPNSHIKEWQLLFKDGALWLCLILELQRPVPEPTALAAGLDVGWRRTEEGIRFGTLYEPSSWTVRELIIDLQQSPRDHKDRVPFRIDMGPAKWNRGRDRTCKQNRILLALFPEWQKHGIIPNPLEVRVALQTRRDYLNNHTKILLCKQLGEATPGWLDRAGRKGLLALKEQFKDNPGTQEILNEWEKNDDQIGTLSAAYNARLTAHLEYDQMQVALDVCGYLREKGITRLIVETNFLAKVAQKHDNEDPVSLKRSQKYRQFAAVGKFVQFLKDACSKCGILVDTHINVNITRICQYCNHLNPATEKEVFQCEGCHRLIKQDHNTAVNLSRFGTNVKLAEMALNAGREPQEDSETPEVRAEDI
jgi:hypothetical protein